MPKQMLIVIGPFILAIVAFLSNNATSKTFGSAISLYYIKCNGTFGTIVKNGTFMKNNLTTTKIFGKTLFVGNGCGLSVAYAVNDGLILSKTIFVKS
jgi:hypothetical protein